MQQTYSFYKDGNYLGFLVSEDFETIETIANQLGATSLENDDTYTYYYKCSFCGDWCEESELDAGICTYCEQAIKSRGE